MHRMKLSIAMLTLTVALFASGFPVVANAEIKSIAEAINKAGRQRMLSQRIVRAYSQIGLDVKRPSSEKMLSDAVKLFDEQLKELAAYVPTEGMEKQVKDVQKLWRPFKKTATGKVNKRGASKLLSTDDELLEACHQLVLGLQNHAGTRSSRLINIAGRQRMLSQRVSKFFMLKQWGIDDKTLDDKLKQAFKEFRDAMDTMNKSELNNRKSSLALKSASQHFDIFETMLGLSGAGARVKVSEQADYLLTYMDRITGMYQGIAEKE